MKFPPTFCQQIYNYEFDKPEDYSLAVFIPNGIYFTDLERRKYKSAKRRIQKMKKLQ